MPDRHLQRPSTEVDRLSQPQQAALTVPEDLLADSGRGRHPLVQGLCIEYQPRDAGHVKLKISLQGLGADLLADCRPVSLAFRSRHVTSVSPGGGARQPTPTATTQGVERRVWLRRRRHQWGLAHLRRSTTSFGGVTGCPATRGYDLATGGGTVAGAAYSFTSRRARSMLFECNRADPAIGSSA